MKQAKISLSAFDRFLEASALEEKQFFELMAGTPQVKYSTLQKMINYWGASKMSPSSIKNYWHFLKNYFWFQNTPIIKEEMKAYVKFPRLLKEMREPLEIPTIQKLIEGSQDRYVTLWLVLASSGMRIEEALSINEAAIEWGDPTRILLSPEITKYSLGRETYISKQAAIHLRENLDEYLKLNMDSAELYFNKLRRRLGFIEKYSNGYNYKVHIHAFKAFFMTAAALCHNESYAHALGGHAKYLPQYFRTAKDKREAMYRKLEPYVTIP